MKTKRRSTSKSQTKSKSPPKPRTKSKSPPKPRTKSKSPPKSKQTRKTSKAKRTSSKAKRTSSKAKRTSSKAKRTSKRPEVYQRPYVPIADPEFRRPNVPVEVPELRRQSSVKPETISKEELRKERAKILEQLKSECFELGLKFRGGKCLGDIEKAKECKSRGLKFDSTKGECIQEAIREAVREVLGEDFPTELQPVVLPDVVEEEVEEDIVVPTQKIDVAEIICSYVRLDKNILEHCTTLGDSLAKNLIRIAATRIFANPYQSILELPVNSIDSYAALAGKKSSIGKFGMGFFSILCWIFDQNATIKIHSTFHSKTKGNLTYEIVIYKGQDDRVECIAQLLEPEVQTGSSVSLVFDDNHKPTMEMFDLFKQQLNKLVDITTSNIVLVDSTVEPTSTVNINQNVLTGHKDNLVLIEMAPTYIKVQDKAQGIPYKVVFNSLLVPSSSTKTINRSIKDTTLLADQTRVFQNNTDESVLMITVNDVVVVKLSVKNVIIPLTFVVSMKPSTSIPVSRDDVILKGEAATEFEEKCQRLVKQSVEKYKDVSSFIKVLKAYTLQSNQKDLYSLASNVLKKIDSEWFKASIFVQERSLVFDVLRKMFPEVSFITHSNPNMYDSELKLLSILSKREEQFYEDVFPTRAVFVLDDNKSLVSTEGLTSLVFVSKNVLTKNPNNWKLSITQSVHDTVILTDEVPDQVLNTFLELESHHKKLLVIPDDKALEIYSDIQLFLGVANEDFGQFFSKQRLLDLKVGLPTRLRSEQHSSFFLFPQTLYKQYVQVAMCAKKIFNIPVKKGACFSDLFKFFIPALFYANIKLEDIVVLYKMLYSKISVTTWHSSYGDKEPDVFQKTFWTSDLIQFIFEVKEEPEKVHTWLSSNYKHESLSSTDLKKFFENHYRLTYYIISNMPTLFPTISIQVFFHFNFRYISMFLGVKVLREYLDVISRADPNEMFFLTIFASFLSIANIAPNKFLKTKLDLNKASLQKALELLSVKFDRSTLIKFNQKFFYDHDYDIKNYILDICIPIKIALEQYQVYQNMMVRKELIKPPTDLKGSHHKFSVKKLIAYLFAKEINVNNLDSTLDEISKYNYDEKNFGLQVVDIAVNEGTTKDFIKSVLTETIQNSIDAIRSSKVNNKDIRVEVNANFLSIQDFVGIPNKGIISLLIPFLSTKDATQAEVTGEMGTGFFNIYRQPFTSSVEIMTCLKGIKTNIIAVPTVVNGRVTNIEYKIKQDQDPSCEPGTTIKVYFNKVDQSLLINSLVDAIVYVDKFLSYISSDFKIYLNSERINDKPKEILFQSSVLQVYYVPYNRITTSIMMTNNIPFTELENFYAILDDQEPLNNTLKTNLIINISKEYYTPVHSRSKINISGKMLTVIQELDKVLFYALIHRYNHVNSIRDSIVPNSQSSSGIDQLMFDNYLSLKSKSEILDLPLSTLKDFRLVISYIIMAILEENRKPSNSDIRVFIDDFLKNSKWDSAFNEALKIWFSNKNKSQNKDEKGDSKVAPPTKSEPLTKMLSLIYDLSKDKVQPVGRSTLTFENPPTVYFADINPTTLGFYRPQGNVVHLNRYHFTQDYVEGKLRTMTADTIFDFDDMMNKLFAINFVKAGTFVHETSHSWRRDDSNGDHADIDLKIGDEPPQTYTFDKACSCVYSEAIKNGLLQLFMRSY